MNISFKHLLNAVKQSKEFFKKAFLNILILFWMFALFTLHTETKWSHQTSI